MIRLVGTLLLGLALGGSASASAQQPDTLMTRMVLPRDYPARLLTKVGHWRLLLVREDRPASLDIALALGPDSVTGMANALQLSHTCYDCLGATLNADWRTLVTKAPTSSRLRLHTNDTTLTAVIGTTVSIVGVGDLELIGRWQGDSAVGTWQQLPDRSTVRGRFVLRRAP